MEAGKNQIIKKGSIFQINKYGYLKCIVFICFLLPSLKSSAPGLSVAYIVITEPIDAYKRLIDAIVMVESAGDTLAVNISEHAYGAFQIRAIRLLDYYQRTGRDFSTEDCFNYAISREIFLFYAENMGYPDYQTIARMWNGSGKMTLAYWEKVKKHL